MKPMNDPIIDYSNFEPVLLIPLIIIIVLVTLAVLWIILPIFVLRIETRVQRTVTELARIRQTLEYMATQQNPYK